MNVLIACECSGVVREAFRALGHNAYSCDLKPAADGSRWHIIGDALEIMRRGCEIRPGIFVPWDLVIAHPPCTYICNSGVLRLYKLGKKENGLDLDRWSKMRDASFFFDCFFRYYRGPICVENPVMHGHAFDLLSEPVQRIHRQTIQPHQFGDDASKATQLWLRGLPALGPTEYVSPRLVCLCGHTYKSEEVQCPKCGRDCQGGARRRWANQTDGGQNKLAPSPTRGAQRAVTYAGIARAMASQWSAYLSPTFRLSP